MSSGNRSFDMTELADNLAYNEDHAAASFATPYQKLLQDVPFDAFEYTSPSIQKSVSVLREIQSKHDELKEEFFKKRAALEAKYQKLYQPLYDKRYVIVNGLVEVDGVPIRDVAAEDDAEKGIPNFWLAAMKNNEVIEDEIYENDEGALGYLKDIRWSRMDEPTGFKLDFFFDKNPYFENSVLTKIYHMRNEQEEILEKATGTEIRWHPGKCLTSNTEKEGKILRNFNERESFFDFFNPPPVPAQQINIDEDDADKLQKQMEQDYDVGTTIRDKIIPHAVLWFTGEAHGAGYNLDDSDTDDDDGDDEEYEDADWF